MKSPVSRLTLVVFYAALFFGVARAAGPDLSGSAPVTPVDPAPAAPVDPAHAALWPMQGHDPQHTDRSPYNGPGAPTQKWTFSTGGAIGSSPAIGADGTVYVSSADYNLYAVNPDGTRKWTFATVQVVPSSPVIGADGTVYVGANDGKLYAVNQDGTQKWVFTTGDRELMETGQYRIASKSIRSSPAIGTDGTIYVSSDKLYAVNPDGTQRWKFAINSQECSAPAIGKDGTVYIGSSYKLYAINPDGTQKWMFAGVDSFTSPTIGADDTIYTSLISKLYAIAPDGTQRWAFTTGNIVTTSPAVGADGTVYVGSYDHKLYAINPDGTQKWAFTADDVFRHPPVIGADGTLYMGLSDQKLYAVNPDGTQKWVITVGEKILSFSAIGADRTLYLSALDGKLYAIGDATPFAISPNPVTLAPGATQQFTVNIPDRVIWKAEGGKIDARGVYTVGGKIDATGLYTATAGAIPGAYTVTAALGNKVATATVTITAPP